MKRSLSRKAVIWVVIGNVKEALRDEPNNSCEGDKA